ncbi:MAG: winged helix-turn-helix transcriptional regulator [SAR202 cluster bacterium]|nr:winged helix-turn-helix transcriptional regulator [SAR202 cluster bacterium]
MPVAPNDLITKINLSNYQIDTLTDSVMTEKIINQGNLKIDTEKYLVTLEGKKIDLTFKELELLKVLSSNPGRVFSRENLLKSIWDYDYYGGTRTVDVHVRRLRRKIEDHKYNFIETIWNVGYKFNEIELG